MRDVANAQKWILVTLVKSGAKCCLAPKGSRDLLISAFKTNPYNGDLFGLASMKFV